MSRRVLVVDDEARIREVVEYALTKEGFEVVSVPDGRVALTRLASEPFDLVVLDVSMPGVDGLEVVRTLRARETRGSRTNVLFLSARGDELDRVLGLELGGDDYLVKPFGTRELVARARALLRRGQPGEPAAEAPRAITHRDLTVDLERWEVRVRGQLVALTRTELLLLAALVERPGVVLTRGQLVQRAYPHDNVITERTIDTHVRRLRAKLRPLGIDPVVAVHGVGYKASDAGSA